MAIFLKIKEFLLEFINQQKEMKTLVSEKFCLQVFAEIMF